MRRCAAAAANAVNNSSSLCFTVANAHAVFACSCCAENAWGRDWGWDPKETWAFITWVVYAAYLHARSTAGWRGNRASWIAILGLVSFLINYFGVNMFVNSLHSYAGL